MHRQAKNGLPSSVSKAAGGPRRLLGIRLVKLDLFRRSLGVLAGLALLAGPAAASEWISLSASYSVSIAGLPIGQFGLDGTFNERAYRLDGSGGVTGFGRLVSSGRGMAQSNGTFVAGRVLPARYAYQESGQKTISIGMDMSHGEVRRLSVVPPVEPHWERVPVTEAHKRGIVDPMSGLLYQAKSEAALLSPAVCGRSVPIFDGRQRFDIELSFAGTRPVRTPRGYQGLVVVCRAAYRPIAGHRPTKKEVQQMQANRNIEVWFAPVEGTRVLLPYRVGIHTPFGEAVAEADRFEARPGAKQAAAAP